MARGLLALLLLGSLSAGCLSGSAPLAPASSAPLPWLQEALGLVADLPCEAAFTGPEATSANMRILRELRLDLHGDVGAGEMALQGDRAYVARYGTGGFSIVDLRDPLDPVEVGVWDPEQGDTGLDVKALPDGSAVVVGGRAALRLVDVRDPTLPVLEDEEPFSAAQAHMLTVFTVQGEDYVAVAKGDGEDLPIYRIAGEPGAHTLERVASPPLFTLTQLTGIWSSQDTLRTHDAFFYDDPRDGPMLWVANVWDGIAALDVSDPAQPREVLRIPNDKPQYTHTVQTAWVDHGGEQRRLTVSVTELGYNELRVFDTTDLAAPRLLATWNNGEPWRPQHNLQLLWPWLLMAHYDQGVLAFDLTGVFDGQLAPMARLASAGSQLPRSGGSPTTQAFINTGVFDGTWDVGVRDGLVFSTDGALRVAAFGCIAPGSAVRSVG